MVNRPPSAERERKKTSRQRLKENSNRLTRIAASIIFCLGQSRKEGSNENHKHQRI